MTLSSQAACPLPVGWINTLWQVVGSLVHQLFSGQALRRCEPGTTVFGVTTAHLGAQHQLALQAVLGNAGAGTSMVAALPLASHVDISCRERCRAWWGAGFLQGGYIEPINQSCSPFAASLCSPGACPLYSICSELRDGQSHIQAAALHHFVIGLSVLRGDNRYVGTGVPVGPRRGLPHPHGGSLGQGSGPSPPCNSGAGPTHSPLWGTQERNQSVKGPRPCLTSMMQESGFLPAG